MAHLILTTPFDPWLLAPLGYLVLGWLVGVLLERVATGWLRRLSARTPWEGDDIFLDSLHGLTKWIGALAGLHLSMFGEAFPSRVASWLQKGTIFAGIFVATAFASRVAVGFVRLYTRSVEGVVPSTSIFHSLTRVVVFSLGGLIAMQSVGFSIAPILTALGVGGLATALALQPTLANLFSGIQILASRTINGGDFVRLDSGEEGHVVDINWRTTTIRSLPNSMILVPNSRLANAVVTNYQFPDPEISVLVTGSVAYGTDLERMERIVGEVGEQVQNTVAGAVANFRPTVRLSSFVDLGIAFSVVLRASSYTDQFLLKHEFIKRLDGRFQAEGIKLP